MATPTFEPDHQGNLELQFSAGFGDAVSNDGTVNNPSEDVYQDGLHLNAGIEVKKVEKYALFR